MAYYEKPVDHIEVAIRAAVGERLDHLIADKKNNGIKGRVFSEFATLIRDTVKLDPLIRQSIEERFAAAQQDVLEAKKRAQWAESEYNRFFEELKQERDADPEEKRLKHFLEILDRVVPLPVQSRSNYNGDYRQALRSRGVAFAALLGLKCIGGSQPSGKEEEATADPISTGFGADMPQK
jgi:hypothetical protein